MYTSPARGEECQRSSGEDAGREGVIIGRIGHVRKVRDSREMEDEWLYYEGVSSGLRKVDRPTKRRVGGKGGIVELGLSDKGRERRLKERTSNVPRNLQTLETSWGLTILFFLDRAGAFA